MLLRRFVLTSIAWRFRQLSAGLGGHQERRVFPVTGGIGDFRWQGRTVQLLARVSIPTDVLTLEPGGTRQTASHAI